MHYVFIINGREDKSFIRPEIERQLKGLDFKYEFYITTGIGDATRYVNQMCDIYPKVEFCFIACGGSGTANEVASGIVGREGKYMAMMRFGTTNDILKNFPGRDFDNVIPMLKDGVPTKIDVLKVNDSYCFNVVNIGMEAMVAYYGGIYIEAGYKDGYRRGLIQAAIRNRINRVRVVADSKVLSSKFITQATLGNGRYTGGEYLCAPRAVIDDGLMEVCVFKLMTTTALLHIIPHYRKGTHLDDFFCKRHLKYVRARHVELSSNQLIYLSLDGETIISSHFNIDVLEKAVNIILPPEQ